MTENKARLNVIANYGNLVCKYGHETYYDGETLEEVVCKECGTKYIIMLDLFEIGSESEK